MRRLSGICILAAIAGILSACSRSPSAAASQSATAGAPSARASTRTALATLDLTYDKPAVVGARVHATATGLPPAKTVDLSWGTVTGGWVVEDYYHFRGKKYSETTKLLGQFPVDASGRLNARFVVPDDYGGVHEVIALVDGKPVAQTAINVTQTFAM